ncbi:MAG: hypothetical protein V1820_00915 [archaeon]
MAELARKMPDDKEEMRAKLKSLEELESELGGADVFSPEREQGVDEIKQLQKGLGKDKIFSPAIEPEGTGAQDEDDPEQIRRMILLKIREILASNDRNRAENLRALMSQAPKGMESMVAEIVRKYSGIMNEPGAPIEGPKKIEAQTMTIFAGYREEEKKSSDPYQTAGEGPGFYSAGSRPPDYAEVRQGVDTSPEAAIRKMLGKEAEGEENSSGYHTH